MTSSDRLEILGRIFKDIIVVSYVFTRNTKKKEWEHTDVWLISPEENLDNGKKTWLYLKYNVDSVTHLYELLIRSTTETNLTRSEDAYPLTCRRLDGEIETARYRGDTKLVDLLQRNLNDYRAERKALQIAVSTQEEAVSTHEKLARAQTDLKIARCQRVMTEERLKNENEFSKEVEKTLTEAEDKIEKMQTWKGTFGLLFGIYKPYKRKDLSKYDNR